MASFDENGKYIKTNWKNGDRITAGKLAKIEEGIEAVNNNDVSRHVEADARLDALEKSVANLNEMEDDYISRHVEVDSRLNALEKSVAKMEDDYISVTSFGIKSGFDVDIEENTKRFQDMIDYCKNNKVIVFPAGDFVFNQLDLGDKNNITIKGVSSSFASFMQKNIYSGKITDTFTRIIYNGAKGTTFLNHKSCVLILENVSFYNLKKNFNGTFSDEPAKESILMQHTKSLTEGNNVEKGKCFCFNCGFFGWKVAFGHEFTMQHLENMWGTKLNEDSYDFIKQSCVVASRCRFTQNGIAIHQPVDGRLVDCSFNKNDYGVVFRKGSGFTTIDSCRIEWNNYNGIYVEGAHDVTISNCEFDRNGLAGLYAVNNTNSNFNGIFRRNGAKIQTEDEEQYRNDYVNNVHIYAAGNVECNFIGSNTVCKSIMDTGGSHPERPTNVSNFTNNVNCIIALNNLRGCTKKTKSEGNLFSGNVSCIIKDNMID